MKPNDSRINPWEKLQDSPLFFLEEDKKYIDVFNHFNKKPDYEIKLSYTPEPRLGPVNAPIIILQLNPSHSNDEQDMREVERCLASIKNEKAPHLGVMHKNDWWAKHLKRLIDEVGGDRGKVSRSICSIEFFPYRSKKFNHGTIRLPSESYTFSLVRRAIERDALFIVARSFKVWLLAIPELEEHHRSKRIYECINKRRPFISENNLPSGVFKKVVETIKQYRGQLPDKT